MAYNAGQTSEVMFRAMINDENGDAGLADSEYTIGAVSTISIDGRDTQVTLSGANTHSGDVTVKYNRLKLADVIATNSNTITTVPTFTGDTLNWADVVTMLNTRYNTVFVLADIADITGVTKTSYDALAPGEHTAMTITLVADDLAWLGTATVNLGKSSLALGDVVTTTELSGLTLSLA